MDVVVAHCKTALTALGASLSGFPVGVVHIYSRCNMTDHLYTGPGRVLVRLLPNVGSCDMVYARHIANLRRRESGAPITLFVKDTYLVPNRPHQAGAEWRDVASVVNEANRSGFACGMLFHALASSIVWHDRSKLRMFAMHSYKGVRIKSNVYACLGAWWRAHPSIHGDVLRRTHVVPVCYGGVFAVHSAAIYSKYALMHMLLEELENMEVNHFMERSWALMFLERRARGYCDALHPKHVFQHNSAMRGAMRCSGAITH